MITNISRQLTTGALAIAGTVAALGLGLVGSGADAATISGGSFSKAEQTTEINQTGMLNKFNSSLGTLTGVKLTLTGGATQLASARNNSAQTQSSKVTFGTLLDFTFSNGISLANPVFDFSQDSGFLNYAAGETRNFGPFYPNQSRDYLFPANGDLSNFLGMVGDKFSVSCKSMSWLTVMGGGGNVNATQTTTAGCGASVEYTYTPASPPLSVPEPSAVLGIFAVGGVGFFLRRKS